MPQPGTPLFLERRSYRLRRMMDAVRLLPLLGLGLWMVPLLWSTGGDGVEPVSMSRALMYIFGVWALLIAVTLAFWGRLRRAPGDSVDPGSR